jgi:hypothetical protein
LLQLSKKLGVSPSSIANVVVWGSSSQHQLLPYATSALVDGAPLQQLLDEEEVEDYLQQEWVAAVQQRGRIIHEVRTGSAWGCIESKRKGPYMQFAFRLASLFRLCFEGGRASATTICGVVATTLCMQKGADITTTCP